MNVVDVVSTKLYVSSAVAERMRIGILADGTFEDPENARIIHLAAAGLLLLAIALGVGTWYWWRTSRVEHPALGPLEMMGTRTWRRSDFNSRARFLEEARPANAIHEADPLNEPDEFDLDLLLSAEASKFDDFADLVPVAPAADPVAMVVAAAAPVVDVPAVAVESVAQPEQDQRPDPAVPAKQGVIVIDTAPSAAAPLQLAFDEPAAADESSDDDAGHFDPLLRLNITE